MGHCGDDPTPGPVRIEHEGRATQVLFAELTNDRNPKSGRSARVQVPGIVAVAVFPA